MMSQFVRWLGLLVLWMLGGACANAASVSSDAGTLVVLPAYGEVHQANDEARLTWAVEEQDSDKSAAASRVNRKMKEGMEIIRRGDPEATLKTRGYYTYAVYPAEQPRQANGKPRQPTEWRVGQFLDVTTKNLAALPKSTAAAQRILSLNGLQFRVSEAAMKNLEEKRIEAVYRNLMRRIAAVAKAMGRSPADASLESLDFEGDAGVQPEMAAKMSMRAVPGRAENAVEEPSFEPGETTVQMRAVGKVRFK